MRFFCLALSIIMTSCSVVSSVAEARRGDTLLLDGQYDKALEHYLRADKICSTSVTNRRLAYYYLMREDFDKAWAHFHKTVFMNDRIVEDNTHFVSLYCEYIVPHYEIEKWGQSTATIKSQLGDPDKIYKIDQVDIYVYGLVFLAFENDRLRYHLWVADPQIEPDPQLLLLKEKIPVFQAP